MVNLDRSSLTCGERAVPVATLECLMLPAYPSSLHPRCLAMTTGFEQQYSPPAVYGTNEVQVKAIRGMSYFGLKAVALNFRLNV